MRAFTAAAIQLAPVPGPLSPGGRAQEPRQVRRLHPALRRRRPAPSSSCCPSRRRPGSPPTAPIEELWDLVSEIPGPVTEPVQQVARDLGVHVVLGTYERGPERGRRLQLLGAHRPRRRGARRLPQDAPVLHRERRRWRLGDARRHGDGLRHRPRQDRHDHLLRRRLPRAVADPGGAGRRGHLPAQSALLRSADIWELTSRARAYDNHVFVVGANATGIDPAGVLYFGNSHIVTPIAHIAAKAASHEGWVSALLDPATALSSLTPGSNIGQGFDHLRDRNLDLIRNYRDDLERPAETSFPH